MRSLRAKSSSSTGSSSHRKKEAHSIVHLDADQLDDEREAKEGLTPITLTRWILSQARIGEMQCSVREGFKNPSNGNFPLRGYPPPP